MKRFPDAYRQLISIALVILAASGSALGAALNVTLSVTPAPSQFPFWGAPKVGDGTQITLTATVSQPLPSGFPFYLYTFTAVLMPSGQQFVIKGPSPASQAKWTPLKGGDYNIKVLAKRGAATGIATVDNFHVKPSITSTVQLSASPPVMALPGAFTISATAPPIGTQELPPTRHKFWFSHAQQFVPQPPTQIWHPPINSIGNQPAVWTPSPALTPGAYGIQVYVQSFKLGMLVAEGFAGSHAFPAGFYRGDYIVLLPAGPCPAPTPATDPTQPFGWLNPITPENSFNLPVATPQGLANCAIAGFSINDIGNNPQLRVRTINVSCSNCHIALMAGNVGRDWFCQNILPFGFPHIQPPDDPPETTLFKLFVNWWSRGCPD